MELVPTHLDKAVNHTGGRAAMPDEVNLITPGSAFTPLERLGDSGCGRRNGGRARGGNRTVKIEIRDQRPPVPAERLAEAEARLTAIRTRILPSYKAFLAQLEGRKPVRNLSRAATRPRPGGLRPPLLRHRRISQRRSRLKRRDGAGQPPRRRPPRRDRQLRESHPARRPRRPHLRFCSGTTSSRAIRRPRTISSGWRPTSGRSWRSCVRTWTTSRPRPRRLGGGSSGVAEPPRLPASGRPTAPIRPTELEQPFAHRATASRKKRAPSACSARARLGRPPTARLRPHLTPPLPWRWRREEEPGRVHSSLVHCARVSAAVETLASMSRAGVSCVRAEMPASWKGAASSFAAPRVGRCSDSSNPAASGCAKRCPRTAPSPRSRRLPLRSWSSSVANAGSSPVGTGARDSQRSSARIRSTSTPA